MRGVDCATPAASLGEVVKEIENNKEEFKKVQEQKKEEFVDKASEIIDKALELLKRRYNKALDNENELEELIDIVFKANDPEDGE